MKEGTSQFNYCMSSRQRELVNYYEERGVGPQAIAFVMLLGAEPIRRSDVVWEPPSRKAGDIYWGTRQRAAIAYCLANEIPLDMDAHS